VEYLLTIGTEQRTLEGWGVSSCVVVVANMRGDMMALTVPATASTTPLMNYNTRVALKDASGVWRFAGLACQAQPVIAPDGSEHLLYRVRGGAAFLESTYRQNWRVPEDIPEEVVTQETAMRVQLVSLVTLFRDSGDGAKVTLAEQLKDILDQAVADCADEGLSLGYSLDYLPEISPPEDEKQDLPFLDAIESCLRWCPHVCAYWDYSAGYPFLRFSAPYVDRGGDAAKNVVMGFSYLPRTVPVELMTECKAVPVDERVVKTLSIEYLVENIILVGAGRPVLYRTIESDTSTTTNGSAVKVRIGIPLRGVMWDGEGYTAPEPRPPDGIAEQLHMGFARPWWKFEPLVFVGEDVNWSYKVGEGWSVTGMGTGPANAQAIAQVITRDLVTNRTELQCGPPEHLGLGDIVALYEANRLRKVPGRAGAQQFGFDENSKDVDDGIGGGGEFRFSIIEAGALSDFFLKGRRA
jgi:hypothetical protein